MITLRILLYASALVYLVFAVLFIGRRNHLSTLFALGCISIFIYTLGYGFELGSRSLEEILFWLKFEYFGLPFVPVFWFLFAYKSYMRKEPGSLMYLAFLFLPFITLFFSSTNDYLHFHYKAVSFITVNGSLIAQLGKGPWYYVFIAYSDSLMLATLVLFFLQWRSSKWSASSPSFMLFIGSFSVILFQVFYLLGYSPFNIDLTPFGFLIASVLAALDIFKNDFLSADDLVKEVVFSGIREGILVVDSGGKISDYNKMGAKVFPWLNPDSIGANLYKFEEGAALAACGVSGRRFVLEAAGGRSKRLFDVRVEKLKVKGRVVGKVLMFKDVTAVRKVMRRLYRLANFDTLTTVFNRRRFFDDAEKEISRIKRYGGCMALLMLDLDHFKDVNDKHGHQAGDAVLSAVGKALKARVRVSDIVGRYGGEEFCVVLVSSNEGKALIVAEDIRRSIEALRVVVEGQSLSVTISIGISVLLEDGEDLSFERLLTDADRALFRAKREGRNRVCAGPTPSP